MECTLCGRPVIVEHLETRPDVVHCDACLAHMAQACWPRCAACMIIAMSGYNMGKVRRLTPDEQLAVLWHIPKHSAVWRSMEGTQLVVVPSEISEDATSLHVDAKGWCKRRA